MMNDWFYCGLSDDVNATGYLLMFYFILFMFYQHYYYETIFIWNTCSLLTLLFNIHKNLH